MLADYVLIVFAAGGRHYPDFKWFWTAWGRLGRPFRKNLKKLVRVLLLLLPLALEQAKAEPSPPPPPRVSRSTSSTQTSSPRVRLSHALSEKRVAALTRCPHAVLFTLAGGLISPKFFQKLVYLKTLSDLAKVVPLEQILVPPEAIKCVPFHPCFSLVRFRLTRHRTAVQGKSLVRADRDAPYSSSSADVRSPPVLPHVLLVLQPASPDPPDDDLPAVERPSLNRRPLPQVSLERSPPGCRRGLRSRIACRPGPPGRPPSGGRSDQELLSRVGATDCWEGVVRRCEGLSEGGGRWRREGDGRLCEGEDHRVRPLLSRPFRPSFRRIADLPFPRTEAAPLRPKLSDCLAMSSVRSLLQSSPSRLG